MNLSDFQKYVEQASHLSSEEKNSILSQVNALDEETRNSYLKIMEQAFIEKERSKKEGEILIEAAYKFLENKMVDASREAEEATFHIVKEKVEKEDTAQMKELLKEIENV